MAGRTRDEWMAGYACALLLIYQQHRDAQAVCEALRCVGGPKALDDAGAEELDLAYIRSALLERGETADAG